MVSLRSGAAGAARLLNEYVLAKPATFNFFCFKGGVFYVPPGQVRFRVDLHSQWPAPDLLVLTFVRLPRLLAPLLLPLQNFPVFRETLATGRGALAARLRAALIRVGDSGPYFSRAYADWISWFDVWPPGRAAKRLQALGHARAPAIGVVVLRAGAPSLALERTLESLRAQILSSSGGVAVAGPDGAGAAPSSAAYLAILQAGEIMPPHGLLVLAEALCCPEPPLILLADEDRLTSDGARADPLFKPEPSLTMMCSGLLARGVWVIRRDLLEELGPLTNGWAECLRLQAWFHAYLTGRADQTRRVPAVLTHRSACAETAPAALLSEVVEAFLAKAGFSADVVPAAPLRVHWQPGPLTAARVSLLVPSKLLGEMQLSCMLAVLEKTSHSNFEMRVIVAQASPFSALQTHAAQQIRAFPNARVELVQQSTFNYSAVNNLAASNTEGDFICLLNDDVAPLQHDWLDRLLAFFQDSTCGIVGPRLLYPNGLTQHGGVIVGLAGLVDHANRFLPHNAPGYAGRARLDQEYSAVTGACLLVRRSAFDMVGGLDETYPIAFNDIDFCLRVRQRGFGVVYAGSVEMTHHESLTFVRHYEVNDHDNPDIERFRTQWAGPFVNDPFHNPNLSLKPSSEWQLAFPPRTKFG